MGLQHQPFSGLKERALQDHYTLDEILVGKFSRKLVDVL